MHCFPDEWTIFATEENLAGSIDFVSQARDGSLISIDWKRSRNLRNKLFSYGRFMRAPLTAVPDSTLWHYRLQLNCYAWILHTYYDRVVSKMLVVCTRPDNGSQPFVDYVPPLTDEVNEIMQIQRANWRQASSDARDSRGGCLMTVMEIITVVIIGLVLILKLSKKVSTSSNNSLVLGMMIILVLIAIMVTVVIVTTTVIVIVVTAVLQR